jgi:hypothetical protein
MPIDSMIWKKSGKVFPTQDGLSIFISFDLEASTAKLIAQR